LSPSLIQEDIILTRLNDVSVRGKLISIFLLVWIAFSAITCLAIYKTLKNYEKLKVANFRQVETEKIKKSLKARPVRRTCTALGNNTNLFQATVQVTFLVRYIFEAPLTQAISFTDQVADGFLQPIWSASGGMSSASWSPRSRWFMIWPGYSGG